MKINIEKTIENRHLEDQIFEVRVPMQDVVEVRDGVRKNVSKKLFPGYVLVNMVMNDDSKWIIKSPKTIYSTRTIKAPKHVLDLIKQQGYITHCNPNKITGYFAKYCQKAQIYPYNFHSLRHYCASVFHFLNIPMSYTQEYGGWGTDGKTLQKIYQHTLRDESNDVYNKAIKYFSKK